MGEAKNITIQAISPKNANAIIKRLHYSGKVVNNSQLHFGVFLHGRCGGALQFGPSLDKRKLISLVKDTKWNEFIELNRMALADWLPRNGESRSIGLCMKVLKKNYPHLKWVVSFADATQCGDGTIYRASNFILTGIKTNTQIWEAPTGEIFNDTSIRPGIGGERERAKQVFNRTSLTNLRSKQQRQQAKNVLIRTTTTKGNNILETGGSSMKIYKNAGWKPKKGYQLRYIYFLKPECRKLLTVPKIPFSKIGEVGAGMYLGQPKKPRKKGGKNDSL